MQLDPKLGKVKSFRMDLSVAFPAKSDEVFFNIIAQLAARCNVLDF